MAPISRAVCCLLLLIAFVECSNNDICDGLGTEMCPEKNSEGVTPGIVKSDDKPELAELIARQNEELDRLHASAQRLAVSAQEIVAALKTMKKVVSVEQADVKVKDVSVSSTDKVKVSPKGRVVARYKPAWSEHFQFLSAVRVDAPLSCLHVLPQEGEDGLGKYVAVGDEAGHLYIFSSHGDLLVDYASISTAPVTVMMSIILRRNETLLVTGHSNGAVIAHRVLETVHRGASAIEDWSSLSIQYGHSFMHPDSSHGTPVVNLEMYRVGRMRYLLVADAGGKIQVFRENGTLYGTADSHSRPLAFLRSSSTQRLLFLTASGAASLDLRTMTIRTSRCQGLDNSSLVAYAFDAVGRSKAYGFTEDGNLIYVALSGDTLHFDCHAKAKRKLEAEGPVKLHGLKGYILIATPREVSVYNTTMQSGLSNLRAGGPRSLFTASMDEISQMFLATPVAPSSQPFLVCDRDKLVVLGFGDGYVGMFRSNLPVHRPQETGARFWGGPLFVSLTVVVLAWYFFTRKREQLKLEDTSPGVLGTAPVPSASATAVSASSPGENSTVGVLRGYDKLRVDSSLLSGLVEKREGGLLDDSRRFGSPSRVYGAGASTAGSYGVGSVSYRNPAVEHGPF